MHLFYTETCPPNYNPAGFLANESMSMTVPETDQWIVNTAALGAVDSGYHW